MTKCKSDQDVVFLCQVVHHGWNMWRTRCSFVAFYQQMYAPAVTDIYFCAFWRIHLSIKEQIMLQIELFSFWISTFLQSTGTIKPRQRRHCLCFYSRTTLCNQCCISTKRQFPNTCHEFLRMSTSSSPNKRSIHRHTVVVCGILVDIYT